MGEQADEKVLMRPLIDFERAAALCDAGQPDYFAAVCVSPDGDDVLWLVSRTELDEDNPRGGFTDQPHEQLGPLPPRWAARVELAPLRCGRQTKAGAPCRAFITDPRQACAWHRTPTERNHQ